MTMSPVKNRYNGLARAVTARAASLQRQSTSNEKGTASAQIARLRRAVNARPGSDPDVWDSTIGLVPEPELGPGDEPSRAETAAHVAMTMFALHRQGKCTEAHVTGVSLAQAVRALSRSRSGSDSDESEGVRRRFDALLTATDPVEASHHLRGLVLLLRSELIGLDYGRLAVDLADLWSATGSDRVRLRWAREYRRLDTTSSTDPTPTTAEELA
jgi:CRISPR system Cascade subunit CasB